MNLQKIETLGDGNCLLYALFGLSKDEKIDYNFINKFRNDLMDIVEKNKNDWKISEIVNDDDILTRRNPTVSLGIESVLAASEYFSCPIIVHYENDSRENEIYYLDEIYKEKEPIHIFYEGIENGHFSSMK